MALHCNENRQYRELSQQDSPLWLTAPLLAHTWEQGDKSDLLYKQRRNTYKTLIRQPLQFVDQSFVEMSSLLPFYNSFTQCLFLLSSLPLHLSLAADGKWKHIPGWPTLLLCFQVWTEEVTYLEHSNVKKTAQALAGKAGFHQACCKVTAPQFVTKLCELHNFRWCCWEIFVVNNPTDYWTEAVVRISFSIQLKMVKSKKGVVFS